jgi:hypothetical protein
MDIAMNTELQPKVTDRIVCVKVGKIKRENLYEMTRKYWAVNINRASKATHVLSIVDGIVETVYIPKEWFLTQNPQYEGRCEFVGVEDVKSEYIGKSVSTFYGKSQNPVKYINL